MIQPRPYLNRLPILSQSHQSGNYGLHGRSLLRRNLVLRIAGRRSITSRILIKGRQNEFIPLTRLRDLYCGTQGMRGMVRRALEMAGTRLPWRKKTE